MAVSSFFPYTMQQVLAEFLAPITTPFSAMVKGGVYVPTSVVGGNIPTTLPMRLSQFKGAARPASTRITAVVAPVGAVSGVSINGMSAIATITHPDDSADTTVSATATLRVTVTIDVATTAKLRLAPTGTNGVSGGIRLAYSNPNFPVYDHPAPSGGSNGLSISDSNDSRQGLWSLLVDGLSPSITSDEGVRIANSKVLSNACVDGNTFNIDIELSHVVSAYIGNQLGFGGLFTQNIVNRGALFRLSLLFLDNTGTAIVQEIPFFVTIRTAGSLTAAATEPAP